MFFIIIYQDYLLFRAY